MELKVKLLKWSAGSPVAMLNSKTAEKIGVHSMDRISLKCAKGEMATIIDTIGTVVKENEIAVSTEIRDALSLKKSQKLEVNLAPSPESLISIKSKLNSNTLSEKQIYLIIQDIVDNNLSEAEIALFVSAMYKQGMDFKETVSLINAILKTGNKLDLNSKYVVDKHSIGGIPGNRTTPIIVAVCAAAGLIMPKSSSRAITTSAGTADVMETIAKIEFSIKDLKKIVKKTNGCLIWGGGLGMVPADSKIIKIEKKLGIDPEAQLLASIMSKKLALGANYIIIDIPYGKTAKVNKKKALDLKKKFEKLGKHFKKKLKVLLTKADQPMGIGVGPTLELKDVIAVLDPKKQGPKDLEEKSLFLASELLKMTKKGDLKTAQEILHSGKAYEKFKQIIKSQGGKIPNALPQAKYTKAIKSKKAGTIKEIDNKKINNLGRAAGAPVDKLAGLEIHHEVGCNIKRKEPLVTIHAESRSRLRQAIKFYKKERPILVK
jgi:AMP phosphorylase